MTVDTAAPRHPAPYSEALLPIFAALLDEHLAGMHHAASVLDPMAGTGRIHRLQDDQLTRVPLLTSGVELMPKWAAMHGRTRVVHELVLARRA